MSGRQRIYDDLRGRHEFSPVYVLTTLWRRREVMVSDTWALRRAAREMIGRRRSATMTYHKIGANSFQVRSRRGRIVMNVWKLMPWGEG